MKHFPPSAIRYFFVLGLIMVTVPTCLPLLACDQESPDASDLSLVSDPKRSQKEFGRFGDRHYPTFCIEDVIIRLTTATEELITKKLTKNATELRKDLGRLNYSMKLIPEAKKPISTSEVYQRTSESVFLVAGMTKPTPEENEWKTSFSTAFAIHEDGILSTSAHVFDHEDQDDAVVVMDIHGHVFPYLRFWQPIAKRILSFFASRRRNSNPCRSDKRLPQDRPCA